MFCFVFFVIFFSFALASYTLYLQHTQSFSLSVVQERKKKTDKLTLNKINNFRLNKLKL